MSATRVRNQSSSASRSLVLYSYSTLNSRGTCSSRRAWTDRRPVSSMSSLLTRAPSSVTASVGRHHGQEGEPGLELGVLLHRRAQQLTQPVEQFVLARCR